MSDSLAVKPTISVIVPCYNVEVYIDRVLGSLRSQTFSDFEIIAVDDGSSDGTLGRLEGWAGTESRLRIYSQENQGLYHARLSGIALARGEWITFMDADDEVTQGHLAALMSGAADDVDVVITGIASIGLDGVETRYGPRKGRMGGAEAAIALLVGHHSNGLFPCWNKLYRRSALEAVKFDRSRINQGEDQVFNLRVFQAIRGLISTVEGFTYRYIARPGSIMRSMSERHVADFFELWRERHEAATTLLQDSRLQLSYRHRLMLNVMDFAGQVYRSRRRDLMQQLTYGLQQMTLQPKLDPADPIALLRWLKWRMRMELGQRGHFVGWLM